MRKRKAGLTAQLPATPCTPEMREKVVALSENASVSIAEIQRLALAFFLSQDDSSTKQIVSKTNRRGSHGSPYPTT